MTQAYVNDFAAFAANGGSAGPDWLPSLRRSAIERFSALGFPTTKNEDWHFTSVAPIAEREFRIAPPAPRRVKASDLTPFSFGHPEWPTLVFVDGRFNADLSSAEKLPRGLVVMDLKRAWREASVLMEQHFTKVAAFDNEAFTALNTAFMSDGAVVHLAADAAIDAPIHLIFVSTGLTDSLVTYPRNLIVAERNSKATVLESYVPLGDAAYFTNAVSEVVLRRGATLNHIKLQRESEKAFHVGNVQVTQERDSHLLSFSFATGAALSRTNVHTSLGGEGCGATLDGLYMVNGEQHVDHQTLVEHIEPNTFSRELYKGILDGASHGVFNGRVYVHSKAQKTDGKQQNNNLLLSDRAQIDTKPQLEIFADDVRCTHGATVGRLDEVALFYMKSRGISSDRARDLLTYAFAADVLEKIDVPAIRDELEEQTLRRFTK
jgi:Fe-S cluster assembly protein SufD